MLSNKQFYHRTVRKLVIAFGNVFNNLKMVRYDNTGSIEIERITVPLMYASKEKFYKRITQDVNLTKEVQIVLPRMAFEMTGLSYDPLRKISSQIDTFANGSNGSSLKRVKMTPYNFDFNLHIFVRNTEDGMQIVEQILPFFNPDYSVTIDFLSLDNLKLDVPIVFNSISYDDSYEGDQESTRTLVWTLNFTVKAYIFGPIDQSDIIRKSISNIYNSALDSNPQKTIEFWSIGNQNYLIDELVYQGPSLYEATAYGYVRAWSRSTETIVLYDSQGSFSTNTYLIGAVSNTSYNVMSYGANNNLVVTIETEPSPNTANANSAYGFSTIITEY
jgi:hypothetical protein